VPQIVQVEVIWVLQTAYGHNKGNAQTLCHRPPSKNALAALAALQSAATKAFDKNKY